MEKKKIYIYIPRKNYWPLYDTCALVIDTRAVKLKRPNILTSTIIYLFLIFLCHIIVQCTVIDVTLIKNKH